MNDSTSVQLSPCPFCWSEAIEFADGQIVCSECGARGPKLKWSTAQVIAWNAVSRAVEIRQVLEGAK